MNDCYISALSTGEEMALSSPRHILSLYIISVRKWLPRLILGCQIFPWSWIKSPTYGKREHQHRCYFANLSFRTRFRDSVEPLCVFLFTSFFLCSADFVLQNQHDAEMTVLTLAGKNIPVNTNKKTPACDCDSACKVEKEYQHLHSNQAVARSYSVILCLKHFHQENLLHCHIPSHSICCGLAQPPPVPEGRSHCGFKRLLEIYFGLYELM